MTQTVRERDMLATYLFARGLEVVTYLGPFSSHARCWYGPRPFTTIWQLGQSGIDMLWLQYHDGPTTPGGLDELHAWIVGEVEVGRLPSGERLVVSDE
jgi:hypothetical protein